jgi:hypothetical protein
MLQKNQELTMYLYTKLPCDVIPVILSYEYSTLYDNYYNNYSWEDIEHMVDDVVHGGPDLSNHLFKIFQTMNIHHFYTNVNDLLLQPRNYNGELKINISFDRFDWFYVDYFKHSGRGKQYFLDDDGTNYDEMVRMIMTILKKFDDWFWVHYIDTPDDIKALDSILLIYKKLEKYAYMDNEEFNDDNSVEEASAF